MGSVITSNLLYLEQLILCYDFSMCYEEIIHLLYLVLKFNSDLSHCNFQGRMVKPDHGIGDSLKFAIFGTINIVL